MAQDRTRHPRLIDRLRDAGIKPGDTVGLVGWKYLQPEEDTEYTKAFFVPAAYVQMFERLLGVEGAIKDVTPVLMHPETGLRATIDADQLAAFEWAATRCSLALSRVVSGVQEGESEFDAVRRMDYSGDPLNVHTMFASSPPGEAVIGLRPSRWRNPAIRVLMRTLQSLSPSTQGIRFSRSGEACSRSHALGQAPASLMAADDSATDAHHCASGLAYMPFRGASPLPFAIRQPRRSAGRLRPS
jgi:hypothetical protein